MCHGKVAPCAIIDASAGNALIPPLDPGARARWHPPTDPAYSWVAFESVYAYVGQNYTERSSISGLEIYLRN